MSEHEQGGRAGEARPVLTHRAEEVAGTVEEVIEVSAVLVIVEATATVAKRVRLVVANRLEDEIGLEEHLHNSISSAVGRDEDVVSISPCGCTRRRS